MVTQETLSGGDLDTSKKIRRHTNWFFVRCIIISGGGGLTASEIADAVNARWNLKIDARHVGWLAAFYGWGDRLRRAVQARGYSDAKDVVDVADMFASGRIDMSLAGADE